MPQPQIYLLENCQHSLAVTSTKKAGFLRRYFTDGDPNTLWRDRYACTDCELIFRVDSPQLIEQLELIDTFLPTRFVKVDLLKRITVRLKPCRRLGSD